MLESLRAKKLSSTMLTHFILINLLYPVYTSGVETAYSPDFVLANLFAVLFMAAAYLEGNVQWNKKSLLVWGIGLAMVGFNLFSFYVNWSFYGWYEGQLNMTISFALFAVLLLSGDSARFNKDAFVKFLLGAAVITNIIGFIPRILGYTGGIFSQGILYWYTEIVEKESRYSWIYLHKSEYSFMLVMFLALAVTYRDLFAKKWMFYGSIGVFAIGLVIANTRATMLAALFILAGCMADHIWKKMGGFSWKMLLWLVPVALVAVGMLLFFSRDKNIWTLGDRVFIWAAAAENVLDNPWGIGPMCGLQTYYRGFPKYDFGVGIENCHNVFLNLLLQFSIPAGFFAILSLAAIAIVSVYKNLSFRTLGIWAALLIPMMMDWCVLLPQFSMMLMLLYFIFFREKPRNTAELV